MIDETILKIMNEYKQQQEMYRDYCDTIVFLLEKLLNTNSFQYQMVSSRVKAEKSIRNKLVKGKLLSGLTSITELDDVCGCRVIFYLDSEIQKFLHHIYQEFDVIKSNLRYSNEDYNAYHLVIKFKEDRLRLTEYAQFKDLKCELQLTTVLFHAWSEVSHNITYKTPKELNEFDSDTVQFLKNELKEIMKNFIKPANYKFEFINKEYLNLVEGKQVFDVNFLNGIIQSKNRNEMYEKLLLLGGYVKKYGDKTPSEMKLPNFVMEVINQSSKLHTSVPSILGFGYEHHYIVNECIEILDVIKYQYPEQVFSILVELALDTNKIIRDKALETIKRMSKYNVSVLKKIGLSLQYFLLDQISKWTNNEQLKRVEIIKFIIKEIFKLEYENYGMTDYRTLILNVGLLSTSENVKRLREQAIKLLVDLYISSKKITEQLTILDILEEASRTPIRGNYTEETETLVIENTVWLINWYYTIIKENTPLEIIKKIDEQTIWFKRRFKSIEGLSSLNELIARNNRYTIYKNLIGYDSDYIEEINWRKAREIRKEKVRQYVDDISENNDQYWTTLIIDICASFTINEQGKFTYFNQFLYDLASKNPLFAKKLITEHEKDMSLFLYHIIGGLRLVDESYVDKKLYEWINKGSNLKNCVLSFLYSEKVKVQTLERIFEKAEKNSGVLHEIFRLLNTAKIEKIDGKRLFIKVIYQLSVNNDYWWTNYLWLDEESILNYFNENEQDQILEILVKCPQIDYHVEQILIPIASTSATKIIKFFEMRIALEEREEKLNPQYDAIPFHMNELGNTLKENSEICIPLIFEWFKRDNWLFKHEASKLLLKMFPSFDSPLETYLSNILSNKDIEEAKIILQVLSEYEGDLSIYCFSQKFVITFQDQRELLKQLMHVLSKTGVVSGEYGFVDALKRTKTEIRKWNKSKNKGVREFVKDFIDYLNANITAETKRSDEQVLLMQLEFDKNLK